MKFDYPQDKIFIETRAETLTFGEFSAKVAEISANIASQYSADQFIAINAASPLNFLLDYFAIIESGKIAVLLNSKLPDDTLDMQMKSIGCRVVSKNHCLHEHFSRLPQIALRDISACCVIFTSGSSGSSKAIVHGEGALIASANNQIKRLGITPDDRYLLALPLYHVGGLAVAYRSLLAGARLQIAEDFGHPYSDVEYFRPSHASFVGVQLQRLLDEKVAGSTAFDNFKGILLGGSAIRESLKCSALAQKLPCYYGYGSTETCSAICVADSSQPIDSSGLSFDDCEIVISAIGEILVKSPSLALGSISDGEFHPITDSDGYFHTHDCGTYSQTEGLRVIGRIDRMFVSGGENVYPEEIECALLAIPQVSQAAVIAVADAEFGHVAVAFIRQPTSNLPFDDIRKELRQTLPNYKIPKHFFDFPPKYHETGIKVNRQFLGEYLISHDFDVLK
ncbi:MAG: AMP-binding protein [Candidatus Kapabacteria bacterium]|nr:AMP-binding protein [Candidatus Kapabacteria bacterium]